MVFGDQAWHQIMAKHLCSYRRDLRVQQQRRSAEVVNKHYAANNIDLVAVLYMFYLVNKIVFRVAYIFVNYPKN